MRKESANDHKRSGLCCHCGFRQGTRAKILSGNSGVKAHTHTDGWRVGRVRSWPDHDRSRFAPGVATFARWNDRRVSFDIEKTETPVCWMAQFRDPDGNKLVIHKRKQK